jgi:hypothetical protein
MTRSKGGGLDAGDDAAVGVASTEVAGQGVADVRFGGVGVVLEEGIGGHDEAGGAVAALARVGVEHGLLKGVERTVLGQGFDGGDRAAFGLEG